MKKTASVIIISIILSLMAPIAQGTGVSLYLSPQSGTFLVGSTFTVSIYLNTKGNEINTVEVDLKFSPDVLQVTSPTAGESFVSSWLSPPSYSNTRGTISFRGGILEGISTSAGLISTITFRAKAPGRAKIEFLESSRVLLNDGKGTSVLATTIGGFYEISIPPPEGPKVLSSTHPDSDLWYRNNNPSFSWEKEGAADFSYGFSQNPQEEPDETSEGSVNFKSYSDVLDGVWYFHLRAKKRGVWGKTSHVAVRIDTNPPREFVPRVDPYSRFVYFETEDSHSGIEYYEVSVRDVSKVPPEQPFFTEAVSPLKIPYEKSGKYNATVRAFDKAGNLQEGEINFRLISPTFSYVEGEGIQVKGLFLPWLLVYLVGFILIGGIGYLIFHLSQKGKFGFKKGIKEIEEALTEIEKIEEREREAKGLKEKFEREKERLERKLEDEENKHV